MKKYQKAPVSDVVFEIKFESDNWDITTPGAFYQDPSIKKFYTKKPEMIDKIEASLSQDEGRPAWSFNQSFNAMKFSDQEEQHELLFGADYLTLRCNAYVNWESFKTKIQEALHVLSIVLEIANISSTSVRFINKIDVEEINLQTLFKESPFIAPELLGAESMSGFFNRSDYQLDSETELTLIRALVGDEKQESIAFDISLTSKAKIKESRVQDVEDTIDDLHNKITEIFTSLISESANQHFKGE